jgi:aspartyl protease family protein
VLAVSLAQSACMTEEAGAAPAIPGSRQGGVSGQNPLVVLADATDDVDYTVTFKGTCKYKFVNRDNFFSCNPSVSFTHFKNLTSNYEFTAHFAGAKGAIFVFEGRSDRQPNLENYFLSIDKVKFGATSGKTVTKGVQGPVEGECHMTQNKEGTEYYEIKCDAYDRKIGFEFNFYLTNIRSITRDGKEVVFKKERVSPPSPSPSVPLANGGKQAIPLVERGGVFAIPVLINGVIVLNFLIDSGASSVSIPSDVVSTLVRANTINVDTDFTGNQTYILADGSTVPSQTFRIRSLKIGDKILENVEGSVAPAKAELLLGQSFLSRFKSWSIDNQRKVLVLE